ncbi:MAG: RNA polymerase sigma factor [Intestinibacter sp.]
MNKFKEKRVTSLLKKSPEEGLRMAIDIYGPAVKTICTNILSNLEKEDVEEAISDTFFKLWKNIDNFQINKDKSLKRYIYAIARNVCFDKLRSLNLNSSLFDIDENNLGISVNMEDEYAKIHNEKIIKEILDKFKEPDRSIFILRFFYFEKVKSIALKLNLDEKKVENILYRSKRKLKEELIKGGIIYEEYSPNVK